MTSPVGWGGEFRILKMYSTKIDLFSLYSSGGESSIKTTVSRL